MRLAPTILIVIFYLSYWSINLKVARFFVTCEKMGKWDLLFQ